MGTKTMIINQLAKIEPKSHTEMLQTNIAVRKLRKASGDGCWAETEQQLIDDIRHRRVDGDSTRIRMPFCPTCLKEKVKILLLCQGDREWCSRCGYERQK